MINKVTIKYLYRHTHRPKKGFPDSTLNKVAECCKEHFQVEFKDGFMVVGALDSDNPFRSIRLTSINGFKIVDKEVAVVMDESILFFNNANGSIKINFRCSRPSVWQRLCAWLCPCHNHGAKACWE